MSDQKQTNTKGILNEKDFLDRFSFETLLPSNHLKDIIEHYWFVRWDLPDGYEHIQSVIPHPSVHLAFEEDASHIQTIHPSKYEHKLIGKGQVAAIKFRPAGFYLFAQNKDQKLKDILDQKFAIDDFFDGDISLLEDQILSIQNSKDQAKLIESKLLPARPQPDPNVALVNQITDYIRDHKDMMQTKDVAAQFAISERKLQRLFEKYCGIGVKWIINRYRMHEALSQIETNTKIDWADLALNLGYFDQAHFIRDFKNIFGQSPKAYKITLKS